MTYEDYVSVADAAVYKRVKWVSMHLARIGREEIVEALRIRGVHAEIGDPIHRSGKQFVCVGSRVYRVSFGGHSDNSTEQAAHYRMGVESVDFSDESARLTFWSNNLPAGDVLGLLDEIFQNRVRMRIERGRPA